MSGGAPNMTTWCGAPSRSTAAIQKPLGGSCAVSTRRRLRSASHSCQRGSGPSPGVPSQSSSSSESTQAASAPSAPSVRCFTSRIAWENRTSMTSPVRRRGIFEGVPRAPYRRTGARYPEATLRALRRPRARLRRAAVRAVKGKTAAVRLYAPA
jgi:hypothetical protein